MQVSETNTQIILKPQGTAPSAIMRNDGGTWYFMISEASANPTGSWTSARPIQINMTTGICNINGNAATATTATNANKTKLANRTTNASHYIQFAAGATGNQASYTNSKLLWNPSTGSVKGVTHYDGQQFNLYNGGTAVGKLEQTDTTWFRFNQSITKNIYTPRYIRADGGFFVDGTSKGINGSGNFIGGTISGASDYGTLLRSNANDSFTGVLTVSGGRLCSICAVVSTTKNVTSI